MLNPQGDRFHAGEIAYLRLKFRGTDKDVDGHVKAVVEPIDARGNVVDSDRYEFLIPESLLTKAGVLEEAIEQRAKALSDSQRTKENES